jgi:iron complex outermembrane receptor protein
MRCAHVPSSSRAAVAAPLIAAAVGALFSPEPVRAQTVDAPAAAPAPAAAASAPAETTLPAVRVRGTSETAGSPVIGYAARRSGTATKTDTPLNEVPQSITVIGAEQVRDQGSPNLQEALRYTAGVRTETYGVDNRGDWFSLRGGSNGSTLLDGLRRPLTGYWGIIRYEPYAFERIEVLRGPASVIAGQNGPGGVVNLVSKRPLAEHAAEVGVQLGNYDHKQVQADLTGPLNADGSLLYRVVALSKRSGTQVDHAYDDRDLFAPSLTWRPNAATSFTLYTQYQRDESGNLNAFFPAQGTLLPAPNGPIPMNTFIGEPDWDTYGGDRVSFGWQLEHRLTDAWTLRHQLRTERTDGKMRTMYAAWYDGFRDATGAADPNGTHLNRVFYASDDKDRATNADLLFEGKLRFGSVAHTLLLGVDGLQSRAGQRYYGDFPATPLDVYNPVYGSFPLPPLPDTPEVVTNVRRFGVLVQDQMKIDDRWVLVAGLRRDKSSTSIEGTSPAQKNMATSVNVGGVWLAGDWSPYVNYSESFDPVSGTDAAGNLFKPQRGKQVETGVKWQAMDRLAASAAVYELREKNRLATDPDNVGFSVQRGEVTVKGLELELAGQLASWDLTAQYSYTDAQVTRTGDTPEELATLGQQLEAIPKHSAGLWAVHRFAAAPGLRAGFGVRHVGESGDGNAGGLEVPAVTLFDAMVSYEIPGWRFALNANNLTDKQYVASCLGRGDCWYGNRRRVFASVTHIF